MKIIINVAFNRTLNMYHNIILVNVLVNTVLVDRVIPNLFKLVSCLILIPIDIQKYNVLNLIKG